MAGMETVITEETRQRRQAGDALRRWAAKGRPSGVVRVLQRHGSGTVERPLAAATGRIGG
jgi:hypothetical protein